MGKTHIRKNCPSICALMTLFHSFQLTNLYHSFRKRHFSYNFTCIGSCIPLLQSYFLGKSSTITLHFL